MFFLELKGNDLERLLELAKNKGMSLERFARLVFLKSLRKYENDDDALTTPAGVADQTSHHTQITEIQEYIRAHWKQKSDAVIGVEMGYCGRTIGLFRRGIGLLKKRGRKENVLLHLKKPVGIQFKGAKDDQIKALIQEHHKSKSDEEIGQLMTPPVKTNKVGALRRSLGLKIRGAGSPQYENLDALLREHSQNRSDSEIGKLMDPPLSRGTVFQRRLELRLLKQKKSKHWAKLRLIVEPKEFERMVTREGYTMTDYMKFKNIRCSRERMRQIADELGLKHSTEDRTLEWELARRARRIGNLNLLNRDWLDTKVQESSSMVQLGAEMGIKDADLFFFIRKYNISHPTFRKYNVEVVKLTCAKCEKEFVRSKRWVDLRIRRSGGEKTLDYFCGVTCSGHNLYDRLVEHKKNADTNGASGISTRSEAVKLNDAYITEHWQTMTDAQMAGALGYSVVTVEHKRLRLGFKRTKAEV